MFFEYRYIIITRGIYRRAEHITLDIEIDDLYNSYRNTGGICALSGAKLKIPTTASKLNPTNYFSLSVDRINSAKGYTLDNIQLVGRVINMMKGEMPQDMFLDFCEAIAKYN